MIILGLVLGFLVSLAFVICGYVLKTKIINNRLEGIVAFIIDDIKEHEGLGLEWSNIDLCLEETLKDKWMEVIKRGHLGYYQWLEYRLGYLPTIIGDEKG